jgi:hypothetical protein
MSCNVGFKIFKVVFLAFRNDFDGRLMDILKVLWSIRRNLSLLVTDVSQALAIAHALNAHVLNAHVRTFTDEVVTQTKFAISSLDFTVQLVRELRNRVRSMANAENGR